MIAAQNEKPERQVQDTVWLVKFIYTKKTTFGKIWIHLFFPQLWIKYNNLYQEKKHC